MVWQEEIVKVTKRIGQLCADTLGQPGPDPCGHENPFRCHYQPGSQTIGPAEVAGKGRERFEQPCYCQSGQLNWFADRDYREGLQSPGLTEAAPE